MVTKDMDSVGTLFCVRQKDPDLNVDGNIQWVENASLLITALSLNVSAKTRLYPIVTPRGVPPEDAKNMSGKKKGKHKSDAADRQSAKSSVSGFTTGNRISKEKENLPHGTPSSRSE